MGKSRLFLEGPDIFFPATVLFSGRNFCLLLTLLSTIFSERAKIKVFNHRIKHMV
jgi:hypothetical protein